MFLIRRQKAVEDKHFGLGECDAMNPVKYTLEDPFELAM